MNENFLTRRRTFLQGLALLPLGSCGEASRVEASPATRSEPLQALIDAQAARVDGTAIVIPPQARPIAVSGAIRVPDDATLIVQCDLVGSAKACIRLRGRSTLRFENSRVENVVIQPLAGTITISGLDYSGRTHVAAILIADPGPFNNLRIENFRISNANYGVLRQGGSSSLSDALIRNGTFRDLLGDPIEWNVCPHDTGVVIEDHDIARVTTPVGKDNWGLGVGVAGRVYTSGWSPASSARNFTIRRITGRSLNQLIHVEAGVDFTIEDIRGEDISPRYSAHPGQDRGSAVVCYGCRNFTVANVVADGRVLILSGYSRGNFVVPCADFTLDHIALRRSDLVMQVGGRLSYARLNRIKLDGGSLVIRGEARQLRMSDIDVVSKSRDVAPLTMDPGFLSGTLASFRPVAPQVDRTNVRLRRGG